MNAATKISAETVPSLPELWAIRGYNGWRAEASSWAELQVAIEARPENVQIFATQLRCPDCGVWVVASSEKRGRAAVERHRVGEECQTKWTYRHLLWAGKAPLAVGGAKSREDVRAAMGAEIGPGSFSAGSRGRRSSVGQRDWAPYARILKRRAIKGDDSVTIERVQDCAEYETIALDHCRRLAAQPWSSAEEVRIALTALADAEIPL